jgi:hypothetical protein
MQGEFINHHIDIQQEDWRWVIWIRDNNFRLDWAPGSTRMRTRIGIKRNVTWRDDGGIRHPDTLGIDLLSSNGEEIRVINIYNRDTLGQIDDLKEVESAEKWVIAGDMNAHHPRWSHADREANGDYQNVLNILNEGTLAIEPVLNSFIFFNLTNT